MASTQRRRTSGLRLFAAARDRSSMSVLLARVPYRSISSIARVASRAVPSAQLCARSISTAGSEMKGLRTATLLGYGVVMSSVRAKLISRFTSATDSRSPAFDRSATRAIVAGGVLSFARMTRAL